MIRLYGVHYLEDQILAVIELGSLLSMRRSMDTNTSRTRWVRRSEDLLRLGLWLERIGKHFRTINRLRELLQWWWITWNRVEVSWLINHLFLAVAIIHQGLILIEYVVGVLLAILMHVLAHVHGLTRPRWVLIVFMRNAPNCMWPVMIVMLRPIISIVVVLVSGLVLLGSLVLMCLSSELLSISVVSWEALRMRAWQAWLLGSVELEVKRRGRLLSGVEVLDTSIGRLQGLISDRHRERLTVLRAEVP